VAYRTNSSHWSRLWKRPTAVEFPFGVGTGHHKFDEFPLAPQPIGSFDGMNQSIIPTSKNIAAVASMSPRTHELLEDGRRLAPCQSCRTRFACWSAGQQRQAIATVQARHGPPNWTCGPIHKAR